MESLICNKCFISIYRGKQPYNITQCGHIACQDCLQQVEKQCPQCQSVGVMSLPLKEPLSSQVAPFFGSFTETLETLMKTNWFQQNQIKITMQRFHEIDKKYQTMKTIFLKERQYFKTLNDKYMNLKAEKEKLSKKLSEMDNQQTSFYAEISANSDIFMHSKNPRYSMQSVEIFSPADVTPISSVKSKKQPKTIDGFRIPYNRKLQTSVDSGLTSSNTGSTCSFAK